MARKIQASAGTREAAIHESGHVVAALALGVSVEKAIINGEEGSVSFGNGTSANVHAHLDVQHGVSELGGDTEGSGWVRDRLVSEWRANLVVNVAGLLAEGLAEEAMDDDQFLSNEEQAQEIEFFRTLHNDESGQGLVAGDVWDGRRPFSEHFRRNGLPDGRSLENNDVLAAARHARCICSLTGGDPFQEVEQAERRTCRLLIQRWPLVERLASSLMRRKSGSITLPQILRLLGDEVMQLEESALNDQSEMQARLQAIALPPAENPPRKPRRKKP